MLRFKDLFAYSMLAMPIAFASLPVYVLAPNFYAQSFNISLGLLGGILLLVRIIDGISGIIMGYISDKFARYRRGMFIGFALLFITGFYLLFSPFESAPVLCFIIGLICCAIAYSFLLINLYALGALWRSDDKAKVIISAYRETMTLTGVLLATILPTAFTSYFSIRFSYFLFTLIFVVFLIYAIWLFLKWYRHCYMATHKLMNPGLFDVRAYLRTFTVNQRYFYAIFSFSVLAMSGTIVLVNFFVNRYLQLSESYLGIYLFLYFLSAIIAIPFWRFLSHKWGMLNTWLIAILVLIGFFALGFLLEPKDVMLYGVICVLTGLALGAELVIPPAILAVLIDNDQQQALASGYFALNDFITKLALAIVSALLFGLLQVVGFDPSSSNDASSRQWLLYLYILVPIVFKLVALGILIIWKSRCTQKI